MKKRLINLTISVALILGGYLVGFHAGTPVHAQQTISIPKSYGRVVGTIASALVLEDSTGTIRVVLANRGTVESVITRN